jgi:Ser/Thr protein kinase RdoA (MazF antagonist)
MQDTLHACLREAYNIAVSDASPIDGYETKHWLVHSSSGDFFVKLQLDASFPAAVVRAHAEVFAQFRFHNARSSSFVHIPEPRKNQSGEVVTSIQIGGAQTHVQVFPVIKGPLLQTALREAGSDGDAAAPLVAAFGTLVGRLCNGLIRLPAPAAENPLASRVSIWDLQHVHAQHRSHASAVAQHASSSASSSSTPDAAAALQSWVASAIDGAHAAMQAHSDAPQNLRRSWIHGDLHDMNVIVRSADASKSGGEGSGGSGEAGDKDAVEAADLTLIDTDDCVYSYAVCDVAIAMTYLLLNAIDPIALGAQFLQAVAATGFSLTATEVALLPSLIKARLATSLIMSARAVLAAKESNTLDAEKEKYLLSHAAPAVKALERWSTEPGILAAAATAWTAAVAAGAAAAGDTSPVSYVNWSLETMSSEQRSASEAIKHALTHMRLGGAIGKVIDVPYSTGATAPPEGKAGAVPPSFEWPPGTVDQSSAASFWPSAPFVYDFTGAANKDLASVTGTDPVKLAAFTDMMFEPLMDKTAAAATATAAAPQSSPYAGRLARIGWGRYGEDRILYQSEHFTGPAEAEAAAKAAPVEARTMHLGVDLEGPPRTPLYAPLKGKIHSWARNTAELDYGPTVVIEHELRLEGEAGESQGQGQRVLRFTTLYGHLTLSSIFNSDGTPRFRVGQNIEQGEVVAWIGDSDVNGGWPPHTHFQLQTELGAASGGSGSSSGSGLMGHWCGDYPGVCTRSAWEAYQLLCPDPNLILRCPYVAPVGWTAPPASSA